MGVWFNNFQEFERKQKEDNRLVLNFYYIPDPGEKAKKVKIFAKTNVCVSTSHIYGQEAVDEIKEKISKDKDLCKYKIEEWPSGNFSVLEMELPKNAQLLKKLPGKFETGNYDKTLRFRGFYPERKIHSQDTEKFSRLLMKLKPNEKGEKEIDLSKLQEYINFEFLGENDIRNMPWLYFDIEKPLFKSEKEKVYLKARKKLLKLDKKLEDSDGKHEKRLKTIKTLEERLTVDIEDVGKVKLWEDIADSKVSSIATIWKNCDGKQGEVKEVYIWDPNMEYKKKEIQGYKVLSFETEKELIAAFNKNMQERKPVLCSGHNEVYDITQVREAAKTNKETFHPAVEDINPKRDFVRSFFQRLKQDLIYIDTLWLNAIFYPWLRQKSLGSSLKLASVANFHGIDFTKSLTHAQLRTVELQRFLGRTKEIRDRAADRIFDYVCSDVEPVRDIIEKGPFLRLLEKMKTVIPYCTLTELAFHTNCVNKLHDKEHYDRSHNQRYWKYKQKMRENEVQIFKKRFPQLKTKMMKWAGLETRTKKGEHENVYQLYLPFEEWIRESSFIRFKGFKTLYKHLEEDEKIPYLQYLKNLQREVLVDYYFARRESKIFREQSIDTTKFEGLEDMVDKEKLDSLYGSFNFLKNHFRSIYMALEGKGRHILLPKRRQKKAGQLQLFDGEVPGYMLHDLDLYLLRNNCDAVYQKLNKHGKRNLTSFLKNFDKFEDLLSEVANDINDLDIDMNSKRFVFLYNQWQRKKKTENRFYARYKQSVSSMTSLISKSYERLSQELEKHDAEIIDHKGDYIFVKAKDTIKTSDYFYTVRHLAQYNTQQFDPRELLDLADEQSLAA
ncbi:hypothetical protein GOV14_01610 [Candidatus Pacearchaeota archaeon]|nr:hypothetical protein [Candidatus Pacearchaeota archaeon]